MQRIRPQILVAVIPRAGDELRGKINQVLGQFKGEADFTIVEVGDRNEAARLVNESNAEGFVVLALQSIPGTSRPFLESDKPTVFISETYSGSGEFLLEYPRVISEGKPVVGLSVRDVASPSAVRYVRALVAVLKLRRSRMVVVVGPEERNLMRLEYPLSVDLYSMASSIQAMFGVGIDLVDVRDFNRDYYGKVTDEEAKPIAERWFSGASRVIGHSLEDLVKPAKLYLALRRLAMDHNADAVSMDDIVLYNSGYLDTWPCLPFIQLTFEGYVTMCEADILSGVVMLLMKHYANIPGYINDPAIDMDTGEVVYYHCQAPLNIRGYGSSDLCRYTITPAHGGTKKLSVYVELPVNAEYTAIGLSPMERAITVHTAKAVGNEYALRACATKLVAKANTEALSRRWLARAGWHRVLFYGNWREDIKAMAQLLGLRVIDEDAYTYY